MRDVNNGWLVRFVHANGASFFFLALYLHIARNLYYGLYMNNPKVWVSGILIFVISMATAFIGYVLPWGQMSFWGATVITNLFSSIPVIGVDLVYWLWSGFSVDNPTLTKFFSLHYLLPILIVVMVIAHLFFLHNGNSSSPIGFMMIDKTSFYPHFVLKDFFFIILMLAVYFYFVCFTPNALGHSDNYILANSLVTPDHIVPEWYFLPFYAILRAIPNKLAGFIAMFLSILLLLFLPMFGTGKDRFVNAVMYKPIQIFLWRFFFFNFLVLAWLGGQLAEAPFTTITLILTIMYFGFIFCLSSLNTIVKRVVSALLRTSTKRIKRFDVPTPWQTRFQDPATSIMEGILDLYELMVGITVGILLFLAVILTATLYNWTWVCSLKRSAWYNIGWLSPRKASWVNVINDGRLLSIPWFSRLCGRTFNTLPQHWRAYRAHALIEIVWTIIPGVILIIIAIPSFLLLFGVDDVISSGLFIVTVVGAQWFWIYQYRDVSAETALDVPEENRDEEEDVDEAGSDYSVGDDEFTEEEEYKTFESRMIDDENLDPKKGHLRLLSVDNWLVFSKNTKVMFFITSQDVLHSWAVPSLGIKVDACPGRLNCVTVYLKRAGLYYGQCSELCGVNHAFMPIMVEVTED